MDIRDARPDDIERLTRIWFDGWQDAHAAIVPEELRRARTYASFEQRMRDGLGEVRVASLEGALVGFSMMKGDELNQLYVAAEARGGGAAQALIADAEQRLAAKGGSLIWLACAIGNNRAGRFYEKSGWRNVGVCTITLDTTAGQHPLDIWRFEKALA